MSAAKTLDLLIDLQRLERDRAAGVAAQARRESDTADSTLRMLRGYRSDYDSRSPKSAPRSFTSTAVRVHEAFTSKLDQAIGEQHHLAGRLADLARERDGELAERQRRLKALETLLERRAAAARHKRAKLEQGQTDEFATQSYLRARRRDSRHG
jgi:flagellar FliJ protein